MDSAPLWGLGVGASSVRHQQIGQTCMNKWGLMGILGTLLALILVQALIVSGNRDSVGQIPLLLTQSCFQVSKYIFKRIFHDSHTTPAVKRPRKEDQGKKQPQFHHY